MPNPKNSFDEHVIQVRVRTSVSQSLTLRILAGVAIIIVVAFLAYFPSLSGGFIWDDKDIFLENNIIVKASDGLYRFWCTTEAADYWPVTNSTFWIEWRLWEMNSTGYHLTNLILHIAEALLIWIILRKLSIPGGFLAALIFALHPVNVESVAWIAQRKDILAVLFFLLSILWYMKFDELARRPCSALYPLAAELSTVYRPLSALSSFILYPSSFHLWYWMSFLAFVLAMLSKGSVAILPVLLLGIVWWLRPLTKQDLLRILPFLAVAVTLTVVNVWFQRHGSEAIIRSADFAQRLLGAGGVVWFYLYKALLPLNLLFIYPQWHIEPSNPLWWLPLLTALAVTAMLWKYRNSWGRSLLFAWAFFCVALRL